MDNITNFNRNQNLTTKYLFPKRNYISFLSVDSISKINKQEDIENLVQHFLKTDFKKEHLEQIFKNTDIDINAFYDITVYISAKEEIEPEISIIKDKFLSLPYG